MLLLRIADYLETWSHVFQFTITSRNLFHHTSLNGKIAASDWQFTSTSELTHPQLSNGRLAAGTVIA